MIPILRSWVLGHTDIDPIQYRLEWCDIQLYLYVFRAWITFRRMFEVWMYKTFPVPFEPSHMLLLWSLELCCWIRVWNELLVSECLYRSLRSRPISDIHYFAGFRCQYWIADHNSTIRMWFPLDFNFSYGLECLNSDWMEKPCLIYPWFAGPKSSRLWWVFKRANVNSSHCLKKGCM